MPTGKIVFGAFANGSLVGVVGCVQETRVKSRHKAVIWGMSDVAWEPRVKERYPLLSQALLLAASGQIRNMASMGGNLLQRTRCMGLLRASRAAHAEGNGDAGPEE